MASEITHVVLTDKIFKQYFAHLDKEKFFIGTVLPDIRYFGRVDRDKLHFSNVSLEEIKRENSFLAGLKFHSLLDEVRENYLQANDIYSLCPESKYKVETVKALEDEIYYNKLLDWKIIINYLDDVLPEELELGLEKNFVLKWHKILQEYYSEKPNDKIRTKFILALNFSKEIADEINQNLAKIKSNQKILDIVESLYNNFENLIITKNNL